MAEKLITSRVKQRFDTLANWQDIWATFKPLKGEVCKIQIPANTAVTGLRTSSSVRVMTKTGDGETTLEKLPWDSAIGADETQLSKGTDATASKTLSHGSTFTAITETSVDGHKITDTTTTYTLPSETPVSTDQLTGTAQTPSHGGNISVVTAVAKGDGSHNVDVTTTNIKLPAETTLKKGTDATANATLTHGGTFKAVTGTEASAHTVTDKVTTFTLPAETELSVDQGTATTATLSHSGTVTVISGVTKGDSGHNLDIAKTTIKLPGETSVSVDTLTAETGTLTHGGTFTALTAAAKGSSSHNIDVTPTTFTLPAETTLKKGTDATATAVTLKHGDSFTAMTNTTVSGHTVTDTNTTFTLPSETTLSKGNDSNTTETLSHGGTFTAVTDTTVSGHQISDVTKTFTLPTETAVTVDQGNATTATLSHGGTITLISGVTKGDTSHNIDVAKTTIKLPSETTLEKGTDATGTATTLTHGGKFKAVTDTSVSGHKVTDTVTEFTLPAETTLTKGTDAAGTATTLTHGGKFKAVTDTTVTGHQVTDVVTEFTMPSETAVSVDTLSANTKTLTHGESFTALTAAVKGGSSHNIDVTPTTFTLPALPTGAMIFKGTLGTNGTTTTLPTSPVAGWSYKVITAGTYANQSCTVGDMLVYDGSAWVLIPSGDDEKKGTVTNVATGQGLSGGPITSSGTIKHVDTAREDTTSTATAAHGGTITAVDSVTTNSMGHVTGVNTKTVTLPSETPIYSYEYNGGYTWDDPQILKSGDVFPVVSEIVAEAEDGRGIGAQIDYLAFKETPITVTPTQGDDKTLTHGGSFSVVTRVESDENNSHQLAVYDAQYVLPAETSIQISENSVTAGNNKQLQFGGTIQAVTQIELEDNTSHHIKVGTTDFDLPQETALTKGTDATAASTLSHGGTFTAITETTVSGHQITDTTTTYTLPAETKLSKGTDATAAKTLEFGKTFTAVTDTAVNNHTITDTTTTFTMPSETTLKKGTDATAAVTLTHGGTFTAITDTSVSGHTVTDTTTTFTMPAETALSVDQGTASSSKPAHGGTVTVISGVTKGDSSHNLDIAKTTITFPSETTLSKGTDATPETQTLAHGGTFTAITDIGVSGHTITDKPTTFTLPSETTLSVTDSESGNAVTDVTVSGHAITLKRGKTFLTAHPTISVGTDSTSTQTATHGGTFTAVDSVTRDANGHVTKINTKTVTLPSDANVTQTPTSSNAGYPLLLAPSNQTTATTTTSYFDSGVTLNPSTNTITSNITGSAKSLSPTEFYSTEGSTGYIKFATLSNQPWRQFNAVFLLQNQYSNEYSSSIVKICGSYGSTSISRCDFEIISGDDVSDKLFYYRDGESYTFYVKKNSYSHWYFTPLSNVKNSIVFGGYSTLLTTATTTGTATYNVSASKLATERTIELSEGATGTATSFDGTKDISIPVTSIREAYLQWGGKNFAGSWGPIDAAMVPNFAANRFAFLPASAITSEYSTDGGSTWTATTASAAREDIFANGGTFYIGNSTATKIDKKNYKCRITITTSGAVYSALNKFAIRISTNGSSGCHVKIESRTKANQDAGTNTWVTNCERAELSGWSGWNIINVSPITTHGNNTSQYSQLRFTFGVDTHASTSTYAGLQVSRIMAFGGEGWTTPSNMATDGHLYSYDSAQNATFPAGLNTVGQLKENGTRVSKVGHTHSVTAKGTVSQPTFTGTAASHNHSFTGTEAGHTHTFTGTAANHNHTFTGTKHKHTFTGTAVTSGAASSTKSIYQITGVGTAASHSYTAPSLTATVSNQCLTLTWSAGSHSFTANTVPTREAVTVALAHTHSVTASGTLDEIAATGTVENTSVKPAGTIAETKITPAGTVGNKSITPAGTVSQPTFTGTAVTSGGSSN